METPADEMQPTPEPTFYTVSEVARFLKMSPTTVRRYLRQGKLHGINLGKAWRIPLQEVQRLQQTSSHE